MRKLYWLIGVIIVVGVIGVGAYYLRGNRANSRYDFRFGEVKRGDIVAVISATGVVEPEELVDVGAQVAGRIVEFGKDKHGNLIDYGSEVEENTILAKIDESIYLSEVEMAQAQYEQAKSALLRAEADLQQLKAKYEQAKRDWERAQKLGPSEALSPVAYDGYKAAYEIAVANVKVGEAAIEQAKASVAQAKAVLSKAQRNLGYCTIKSPVKGVIIDRRVNIGQTVVASLNAPSLFLIAKDLKRIQVWVAVNEADIGMIYPGMPVEFTVDAFPDRVFVGEVRKIRLNATMTQNVVTYTVEVTTDNSDQKLLPYLTANVRFITGKRQNVLMVPNSALRWRPRPEMIAAEFRQTADESGKLERGGRGRRGGAEKPSGAEKNQKTKAVVWIEKDGFVYPINVLAGLSDGTYTEVEGEGLTEGMQVVIGEQINIPQTAGQGGGSPFVPRIVRSRSQGQAGGGERGGAPAR